MRSRIGLILAAFSLSALPAAACSCMGTGGNSGACQPSTADVIVLAKVVSKEVASPYAGILHPAIANITLSVSERFRGGSGDSMIVQTDGSTCAYPFEIGHEYLVFANEFRGNLQADICTATRPAKMAASVIRELRAQRDKTTLPDLFGSVVLHPNVADGDEHSHDRVQPVPGLVVTAHSEHGDYRTQTLEDGSYTFQGLSAGRYQVSLKLPPGRIAEWLGGIAEYARADIFPGHTCPTDFDVFYDGRIGGTVTRADGQPAAGDVFALYQGPEKLNATLVGTRLRDGHFQIDRLSPGSYRLVFNPAGEAPTPGRRASHPPSIYYPNTQVAAEATPIEVGDGAHVDGLQFNIF